MLIIADVSIFISFAIFSPFSPLSFAFAFLSFITLPCRLFAIFASDAAIFAAFLLLIPPAAGIVIRAITP